MIPPIKSLNIQRDILDQFKLSQTELAILLDTYQHHIHYWVTGKHIPAKSGKKKLFDLYYALKSWRKNPLIREQVKAARLKSKAISKARYLKYRKLKPPPLPNPPGIA